MPITKLGERILADALKRRNGAGQPALPSKVDSAFSFVSSKIPGRQMPSLLTAPTKRKRVDATGSIVKVGKYGRLVGIDKEAGWLGDAVKLVGGGFRKGWNALTGMFKAPGAKGPEQSIQPWWNKAPGTAAAPAAAPAQSGMWEAARGSVSSALVPKTVANGTAEVVGETAKKPGFGGKLLGRAGWLGTGFGGGLAVAGSGSAVDPANSGYMQGYPQNQNCPYC